MDMNFVTLWPDDSLLLSDFLVSECPHHPTVSPILLGTK